MSLRHFEEQLHAEAEAERLRYPLRVALRPICRLIALAIDEGCDLPMMRRAA